MSTRQCLGIFLLLLAVPAVAGAQVAGGPPSALAGTVVEAATGSPIRGAVVVVEPSGDAMIASEARGTSSYSRTLTTLTRDDGTYRFVTLPPGAYRLHVRHLGYQEAVLTVELSRSTPFEVSIGLVLAPIRLDPVNVRAVAQSFGRPRSVAEEARYGTLDAEELRQSRFLASDARVLSYADLTDAVTLDEGDLLRAMQRLPGVSARDDYNAGIWTRGSPFGHTRVYFDGLPLFNPVHAFGLVSGVSPDILGIASFHPGVRTAAIGEGAAGVLDLTSRVAEEPGIRGLSELSVTNARAALEAASADGSRGLVVAGRRSYIDLATRLAAALDSDSGQFVPYAFFDLGAHGGMRLGANTRVDASGLWTRDDVNGDVSNYLRQTTGYWGSRLGRLTLSKVGGNLSGRLGVGMSRFDAAIGPRSGLSTFIDEIPQHGLTHNRVMALSGMAEVFPTKAGRIGWSAGAQVTQYHGVFDGQYPRPYPVALLPDRLILDRTLLVPALWAEARPRLGARFAIELGARVEMATSRPSVTPSFSPRAVARYRAGGGVSFSAGFGRSWQYTQALAPAGPSVGPDLYLTDVWLLAGDTIPPIRSDVGTVGAELATRFGWVASMTVFARREIGVAVPDPSPGILNDRRPIFVTATNRASGVELGVRKILGQWTTALSYTFSRSDLTARGWQYPSPADRRHGLDVTTMYRTASGWRVGAAATVSSGAPYSRFILGAAACDSLTAFCSGDSLALRIEQPNAVRTSSYAALDAMLDWEGAIGKVRVGAFLQLRNLLSAANAVTYTGSLEPCGAPLPPPKNVVVRPGTCDRFDRGIPLLPLAGVRLVF